MHSLETGIIVSIAAFFFFSFLTFTFLRETSISKEILSKNESEKAAYILNGQREYKPELFKNVVSIIREENETYENNESE